MKTNPVKHTPAQRLVALIYGLLCHLTFGAAVLAMAVSLFTGMRFGIGPFHGWSSILANGLLLATFPVSHSWLLSPRGRRFMAKLVPLGIGSKISTTVFVIISSLQLFTVFVLWSPSGVIWWQAGNYLRVDLGIVAAAAWLLLAKSMADAQLDLQLGLVGWWAVFRNRKAVYKPFATKGLYRFVRQPIYISFALLLWLTTVWTPDQLVLAVAWTGYCIVGALLKEKRFTRYFGNAFREYQKHVPFWVPGLHKKTNHGILSTVKRDADIIIIGAGPIGLLLANLLGRRELRVIVAERRTHPPRGSMAIGITPPSLDILTELSLDREFIDQGVAITEAAVYENGKRLGDVNFSKLPTEHRCILSLPQSRTIRILRKRLEQHPTVTVLAGMQFISQIEGPGGIRVRLQDLNTQAYSDFSASYLAGCDGHRSTVRNQLGISFPGRAYGTQFFMADFKDDTGWGAEARLYFGAQGSTEAFPLPGGQRRWIVQVPPKKSAEGSNLTQSVIAAVRERTGTDLSHSRALFESHFKPQRRLAGTYRKGRTLLCGDAAHVMSPIGGQGMNTGFADAAHLDRALAAALIAPEDADTIFSGYTVARRYAFNVAAGRSARGMWLGTRRGTLPSVLRQILIGWVLLRPTIRERVATYFAMLSIPGNHAHNAKQKVTP